MASTVTDPLPAASLYERLGGAAAIHAVVDGLYRRIEADCALAPFFTGTDMTRQRRHLAALLGAATGGPGHRGRSVRSAHAGRGIGRHHFDAVAGHLVAELVAVGVVAELIDELIGAVAPLAGDIVEPG